MAKLEEYRRKRRFDRTPEPSGESAPVADKDQDKPSPTAKRKRMPKPKLAQLEVRRGAEHGDTFVVQKHRATRLHYDFRLAIDGTLKSWAVPKGPSQSHADKRLAVQTEDHPLDYANFEGKIPEGNYGAGTVMIWDRGTFHVEGNLGALKQLEKGEIKFSLNGEKLRGSFVLVKLKQSEKGNEWLMIKHKDAAEDSAWNIDDHDGSALTGRTLEEIKAELPPRHGRIPIQGQEVSGARKAAMPSRLQDRMHVRVTSENLISQIPVIYYAFDLLYCDGYDLREAPLLERKQLLQKLLRTSEWLRYSDHQLEHGKELFKLAEENGLEGMLAKQIDSRYVSERSSSWLKLKITKTVDAAIGGWSEARTSALPFGSLLLGLYQGRKLRFIGHVGSGFDAKKLAELSNRLKELAASACPFDAVPKTNEKTSLSSPALVARVQYIG